MKSILVVDDDKILLRIVQAILEKSHYSVTTVLDGHAALEKIQIEKFNLIITDLNMPHQFNGFRLIKMVRDDERNKKTPIMVLTGRNSPPDVVRSVEAGADEYVVKPLDFDLFMAKVVHLLETKNSDQGFTMTPAKATGDWTAHFEITGISEQGMTFTSPTSLPTHLKFKMNTELFSEIGVESPLLRVVSCRPFEKSDKIFEIEASFIGLAETELMLVRRWTTTNSDRKTYKSS